jgi:hypothetical protein
VKVGMPWILELQPEYGQLTRRPRRADGFDLLYEVVDPDREYHLRELRGRSTSGRPDRRS